MFLPDLGACPRTAESIFAATRVHRYCVPCEVESIEPECFLCGEPTTLTRDGWPALYDHVFQMRHRTEQECQ